MYNPELIHKHLSNLGSSLKNKTQLLTASPHHIGLRHPLSPWVLLLPCLFGLATLLSFASVSTFCPLLQGLPTSCLKTYFPSPSSPSYFSLNFTYGFRHDLLLREEFLSLQPHSIREFPHCSTHHNFNQIIRY